jgi:hypothetical protein
MTIEITEYLPEHTPAVKAFNGRLRVAGISYRFPETHSPTWLPRRNGSRLYQEYFLAVENGDAVRGGYVLKHQEFSFRGETTDVACLQLPLSEGIVDKAYGATGIKLIADAVKRQPLLFALGMGGHDEAIARLLAAMGWSTVIVPFYFRVASPKHFLRNISFLRNTPLRRAVLDGLAATGLGSVAIRVVQLAGRRGGTSKGTSVDVFDEFSTWSDALWQQCGNDYSLLAVRDSDCLNALYPPGNQRFIKLKISKDRVVVGWAVVLDSQMSHHKQFGDMRIGSIVDCLACPEYSALVVRAASQFLERREVDLIISNQACESWCSALKESGFISGPSNFLFAASKELARKLDPFKQTAATVHINRGDGDGPIHL